MRYDTLQLKNKVISWYFFKQSLHNLKTDFPNKLLGYFMTQSTTSLINNYNNLPL